MTHFPKCQNPWFPFWACPTLKLLTEVVRRACPTSMHYLIIGGQAGSGAENKFSEIHRKVSKLASWQVNKCIQEQSSTAIHLVTHNSNHTNNS